MTLPRLSSGNPNVDAIMKGGFALNSLNLITGLPGTGKSIFTQQLVFHHAAEKSDRPLLCLSTMSEPLAKMLTYFQEFKFFDANRLGHEVIFEDIGPLLAAEGLAALVPYLETTIVAKNPRIVVIDSFRFFHDLVSSPREMRNVLYDLTNLLTAFRATSFLVGEYTESEARTLPEFGIADGIIELQRNPMSSRDERFLRVVKLRGSGYQEGLHAFRIAPSGLELFPRLVSPLLPDRYDIRTERVSTGCPGLDTMTHGGVWKGSSTLLTGPSGAGKTTIALQFIIQGVLHGEPGVYVNFQENPTQLARAIHSLGHDVEELREKGLKLIYQSPVELRLDSVVGKLFEAIDRGAERVVVDAVEDLSGVALDSVRLYDFIYAITQHFAVRGVTSFLTVESSFRATRLASMCDNIISLGLEREDQRLVRTVSLLKSRASAHDLEIRRLEVRKDGVHVETLGDYARNRRPSRRTAK